MPSEHAITLSTTEKREVLHQLLSGRTVDAISAYHNVPVTTIKPLKDTLRNAFGPDILPTPRTSSDDPPVEEGDVLEDARMVAEGDKGDGTTFIDGFTVIVPQTSKGEVHDIRITHVEPTYAFAEALHD